MYKFIVQSCPFILVLMTNIFGWFKLCIETVQKFIKLIILVEANWIFIHFDWGFYFLRALFHLEHFLLFFFLLSDIL